MNKHNSRTLQKELRAAGARPAEVDKLVSVASRISLLKKPEHQSRKPLWANALPFGATAVIFLVMGASLIIFSQATMPGSLLYPVQKLADSAAVAVHPNYRSNVMMKRASQVEWLVSHHANQANILSTLADYQTVAAAYQSSGSSNYEALDYCQSSLKQAANLSTGTVQQAILHTLNSLKSA